MYTYKYRQYLYWPSCRHIELEFNVFGYIKLHRAATEQLASGSVATDIHGQGNAQG